MLRRKVLSLATALVFLITSGVAVAQDATTPPPAAPPAADVVVGDAPAATPADDQEQTEEIVVTGTRIRRKDLTTPAPVTVISREQLLSSGKVTIGDFLQSLPEQGNALGFQVNNGNTESGMVQVNLRSLGGNRTLVLVNGRRLVPGGSDADASVDLSAIPMGAIERIEVLKDGASAVYGSDAIAGVVNVITRKSFSDAEVSATAGVSSRGDGEMLDLNLTAGSAGERSTILFSGGYYEARSISSGARPWSQYALSYDYTTGEESIGGSPTSNIPSFELAAANRGIAPAGSTQLWQDLMAACTEADRTRCPAAYIYDPNADGAYAGLNWRPRTSGDLYNFQPDNHLVQPVKRYSLFAIGDYRLADNARAYFEGSFVNRRSEAALAPMPVTTAGFGAVMSADSLYNPFGVDLSRIRRRTNEFDLRRYQHESDTFRIVGGLDGNLPDALGPLSAWFWDASLNYGRNTLTRQETGQLQASHVAAAVGPSMIDPATGLPICVETPGDPTTVIDGCSPLNLLAPPGAITADQAQGLTYIGTSKGVNNLWGLQANVGGDVFQLLGDRPIAIALGYEYRELSGSGIPDALTATGDTTGNATEPVSGMYSVHEGYAELSIPIVSGMPLADDVELTAALRVFDYSTFGSDSTYKLGARWRPIRDVTFRGTYSTAFRAPSINELYSGSADSFETASDPCSDLTGRAAGDALFDACVAQGVNPAGSGATETQLRTIWGGNPELDPETADIFTLGVVIEPRMLKNFSFTVDYYNIDLEDSISRIGVNTILGGCYSGRNPDYCRLVIRDDDGFITNLVDTNQNVGGDKAQGIDFAVRYLLPTAFGRLNFVVDATYLIKRDQIQADGQVIKGAGNFDSSALELNPRWKGNAGVAWGLRSFGAGVSTRYMSSVDECGNSDGGSDGGSCTFYPEYKRRVGSYNAWDAFVSYNLTSRYGKTMGTLGMRNVFDTEPPKVYDTITQFSHYDYDFVGRYLYFRLAQTF